MTTISDAYAVPKDLPGLCWWMADLLGALNRHYVPRNPSGPNDEDALIIWSCAVQRLEELGIKRPADTEKVSQ